MNIEKITSELYPNYNESYNYPNDKYWINMLNNVRICKDCDDIPKTTNAGNLIDKNGVSCQVMHNGVLIHEGCYHGQWMTDVIKLAKGHHEPQEEKLFYEVLNLISENGIMIECGSFWAYYSLWFNSSIKNARNIMIEPHPIKYQLSKLNFEINNFKGEFINGFISNTQANNHPFQDSDGTNYKVPSIKIDSLLKEKNIDSVSILHADIQDNEMELLEGATNSLTKNKIDFLFLATHSSNSPFIEKLIAPPFGYHIIESFDVSESYFDDGLILACSPNVINKIDKNKFKISKKRKTIKVKFLEKVSKLYKRIRN